MDVLSLANILKNEDINSPNFRRELKNFEEVRNFWKETETKNIFFKLFFIFIGNWSE